MTERFCWHCGQNLGLIARVEDPRDLICERDECNRAADEAQPEYDHAEELERREQRLVRLLFP
jgi:hypothetical protein